MFNLGAQFGDRTLEDTSKMSNWLAYDNLLCFVWRKHWRRLWKRAAAANIGHLGDSAMRGNAGQHAHAAAIGGRRLLCQTLNAELSKGIHICHIYIDAMIEAPILWGLVGEEAYARLTPRRTAKTKW